MSNDTIVSLSFVGIKHSDGLPSAADVSVAGSIKKRSSNCSMCGSESCDSKDGGGCTSCSTKEKSPGDKAPAKPKQDASPIIELEFKGKRKLLFANERRIPAALGELVIAEAETGLDAGRVSAVGTIANNKMHLFYKGEQPLFNIVRLASSEDIKHFGDNRAQEGDILFQVRQLVKNYKLDMKVSDVEWQFDRQRLMVYFTAPQRVDFRELVKELARTYRSRIELRQINAREEARKVGGIGPCGLELCCTTFKRGEFEHITLDHARAQMLSTNITKLSGQCGRLKCCLLYEIDNYTSALQNYPPLQSIVEIPQAGRGRIIKIDIFKDQVTVYTEQNSSYHTLELHELNKLRKDGKVVMADPSEERHYHRNSVREEEAVLD